MRVTAVLLMLSILGAPTFADPASPALKAARERKRSGEVETGLGLGLEGIGLVMLTLSATIPSCAFAFGGPEEGPCAPGSPDSSYRDNTAVTQSLFVAGAAIGVVATVVLAIGIPLWASGAHREKVLRRALSLASGTISF